MTGYYLLSSRATDTLANEELAGPGILTSITYPVNIEVYNSDPEDQTQPDGTPITWYVTASGGSGSYEYQFERRSPGESTYSVVQPWSEEWSWSWTPTSAVIGNNYLIARVRDAKNPANTDYMTKYLVVVSSVPIQVKLMANNTSPGTIPNSVRFFANVTGGSGNFQYQFKRRHTTWAEYSTVKSWSYDDYWYMVPTLADEGANFITIQVREATSTVDQGADYDYMQFDFVRKVTINSISTEYWSGGWVTEDPPQPPSVLSQPVGTSVRFTTDAVKPGADYYIEYKYWLRGPAFSTYSTNTVVRDWDTNRQWVWSTAGLPEGYWYVTVQVRRLGSLTEVAEDLKTLTYQLVSAADPLQITGFTDAPADSSASGAPVTWTTTVTGGTAPENIEYQYERKGPDTGGVYVVESAYQTYPGTSTWDWTPDAGQEGANWVVVKVRDKTSTSVGTDFAYKYHLVTAP